MNYSRQFSIIKLLEVFAVPMQSGSAKNPFPSRKTYAQLQTIKVFASSSIVLRRISSFNEIRRKNAKLESEKISFEFSLERSEKKDFQRKQEKFWVLLVQSSLASAPKFAPDPKVFLVPLPTFLGYAPIAFVALIISKKFN